MDGDLRGLSVMSLSPRDLTYPLCLTLAIQPPTTAQSPTLGRAHARGGSSWGTMYQNAMRQIF
jgi:hypothetical protein